jgi:hypothetical protein
MESVATRAVIFVPCWPTVCGAAWGSPSWLEVGDAGDETNPRITSGAGSLSEIHGSIGSITERF